MRPGKFFCLILLLLVFVSSLQATDGDSTGTRKFFNRKRLVATGLAINSVGIVYTGYKWWWQGNYHPFQQHYEGFFNDYSYGVDKCGHFYISYLYFNAIYQLMSWGGFDRRASLGVAFLLPAFYALTTELGDGFSSYQYSWDDLGANLSGIGVAYLQTRYPKLNFFKIKWSYWPAAFVPSNRNHLSITDDYDGHFYWAAFDVHTLLPGQLKPYWPKFLNLAFGYGAINASFGSTANLKRKFCFGFDYNLSNINLRNKPLNLVKNVLDYFHFPAPGFRKVSGSGGKLKGLVSN